MDKKIYLMQHDCLTADENKLWYIASRFSSLIEINRITGEARELFSLKKEGQYRALIKDKNKLLLIPAGTGYLWIYDIVDRETMFYPIPDEVFYEGQNWSAKYIKLDNYVYFSWASPVIVKYDLSDGQWKSLTKWRELLPIDFQCDNWFLNETFSYNGFLYFQIGTSKMILKLNPDNDEFDIVSLHISEKVVSIDNTVLSNDELWIKCRNSNGTVSIYYCRNWNTYQCEKFLDINIESVNDNDIRMFSIIERMENKLLLLPGRYDKVWILNIENKTISVSDRYPTVFCDRLRPDWFSAFNYYKGLKINGKFLVIHPWTHQLIEINEDEGDAKNIPIRFSDEILEEMIKNEFENAAIYREGILNLDDFIQYVRFSREKKLTEKNVVVSQMIYDVLNIEEKRVNTGGAV